MTPELRADMRRCALFVVTSGPYGRVDPKRLEDDNAATRVLAYLDAQAAAPDFSHVADGYVEADAMDDDYIGVSVASRKGGRSR